MPAIPSSLLEPVWVEFDALLPERGEFHPEHPLGCHRRRIPDRVVFEHVVDALVHGSGYERIATPAVFGLHHPPPAQGVGRRRDRRTGPRHGAGRLRPDHRPGAGRHRRRRLHHQGPVRRRQGRTVPGGPTQRRPETVGGHRRRRRTAGHRLGRRQPPRLPAAGPDPRKRPPPRSARTGPTRSPSTWTPATTPPSPAPCSTGWACTARSPAKAYPHRSRSANGGSSNAPTPG